MTQSASSADKTQQPSKAEASNDHGRRRAVGRLRRAIENADPGTQAALRRIRSPDDRPAAFFRVAVDILDEVLPADGPHRDRVEGRWAILASAVANADGFLGTTPLGKALADANVAEMRVVRLLEAGDATLGDMVRNIVHQLTQRGQPFDPNDLADLVLSTSPEPRRRIARAFYRFART